MPVMSLKNSLFAITLVVFAACYLIWVETPIYSDEFSFRIQFGRYIQDHGVASGLFSLCLSSLRAIPALFAVPAWLFSWMDLSLTSPQIRIVPICFVIGCAILAASYAVRQANPFASLWILAAMIGIAGSSLVFARFEFAMYFNIFFGLWALHLISQENRNRLLRYGVAVALIFSLLVSLYVHPQGIIFLPLTAFLSYRLVVDKGINIGLISAWAAVFGIIAYTSSSFHSLSCTQYPVIEKFFGNMVFQPAEVSKIGLWKFLVTKLDNYANVFVYTPIFQAEYLPGIKPDDLKNSLLLQSLNFVIPLIIFAIALLNIIAAGFLGVVGLRVVWKKEKTICGFSYDVVITYLLISLPVAVLFIYDARQYFYREAVIHFLFTLSLVILFSNLRLERFKKLSKGIGVFIVAVALLSLGANILSFYEPLKHYEGPGVSIFRDNDLMRATIERATKLCKIDVTAGNAVMDDLTYDYVKAYEYVYPITYLGLQRGIAMLSVQDVLGVLKPNYAMARCRDMKATGIGWPPDQNLGELCCTRFTKQ